MNGGHKKILIILFLAVVIGGALFPFAQQARAQADQAIADQNPVPADALKDAIGCGPMLDPLDRCIAFGLYWLLDQVGGTVLTGAGYFFNAMIGVGISSKIISQSSFIIEGWSIARDIANLFFIFILIFIALRTILGLGKSTQGMIAKLIIIAILINFSMFFARVVIDASNGLALLFYNRITVTNKDGVPINHYPIVDYLVTGVEEKDIGSAIVSAFHPQILSSPDFYNNLKEDKALPTSLFGAAYQTVFNGGLLGMFKQEVPITVLLTVIILSGIIYWYAAWCLFIAGLSFLGRIVGLFISLIFVPIALVTYIIPLPGSLKSLGSLSWSSWLSQFLALCFGAPVFMFFLYIIVLFTKADLFGNLNSSTDWITQIVLVAIPLLLVMFLLKKATDYAKKMGGEVGEMIVSWGDRAIKTVGGFAVGAAATGAGFALQSTIGANAQKKLNDKDLQDRAAKGDQGAQRELRQAQYLSTRTFNLRDTGIGKGISKQLGIDMNKTKGLETFLATPGITGRAPLDVSTKGGFAGRTERNAKLMQEGANNMFKMGSPEAVAQDARAKEWNSNFEKALGAAKMAATIEGTLDKFSETDFKELYTQGKAAVHANKDGKLIDASGALFDESDASAKAKLAAVVRNDTGSTKVLNAKELEADRKRNFASTIEYGSDYVVERDKMKRLVEENRANEIKASGKATTASFDEKKWREAKDGIMVGSDKYGYFGQDIPNAHVKPTIDRASLEAVTKLRKEVGDSLKEFETLTGKALDRAKILIKQLNDDVGKMTQNLDEAAMVLNKSGIHATKKAARELTQDDLDKAVEKIRFGYDYDDPKTGTKIKIEGLNELKALADKAKANKDTVTYTMYMDKHDKTKSRLDELKGILGRLYDKTEKLDDTKKKAGI